MYFPVVRFAKIRKNRDLRKAHTESHAETHQITRTHSQWGGRGLCRAMILEALCMDNKIP